MTNNYTKMTEDDLTDLLGRANTGSAAAAAIYAEFQRRSAVSSKNAADSQKDAAIAAISTAKWTKVSAISMATSVLVLILSIAIQKFS